MTDLNLNFIQSIDLALTSVSDKTLSAIKNYFNDKQLIDLSEGKYEINDQAFFMIQNNDLKTVDDVQYEAHHEYLDFQFMLDGLEGFMVADSENLQVEDDQYAINDIAFYADPKRPLMTEVLATGSGTLFNCGIAHKPCLLVDPKMTQAKKMVLKVKKEG